MLSVDEITFYGGIQMNMYVAQAHNLTLRVRTPKRDRAASVVLRWISWISLGSVCRFRNDIPCFTINAHQRHLCSLWFFLQSLRSYFTKTFMAFTVSDVTSTPQRTELGVPRGSVLELLFFGLHVHLLSQIVFYSGFVISDNTQLFNSALPVDFNLISKQRELCVHHVRICMKTNKK